LAKQLSKEEIALLRSWRTKNDALLHFKPTPTQARCDASVARYRLLHGPNRGGKSAYLAYVLAAVARRKHPSRSVSKNGTYLLLAPSREQLIDPWTKKLLVASELIGPYEDKPLIPEWEIKNIGWGQGAGARYAKDIFLLNGQHILMAVSGDKNIKNRLKGKKLLGIFIDEDAGTESLLAELYSRILEVNSDPDVIREAGGGFILWGATDTDGNPAYNRFLANCLDPDKPDFEEFEIQAAESVAVSLEEREKLRDAISPEEWEVRHGGGSGVGSQLSVYGRQWSDSRHMRTDDYQVQPNDNLWVSYDDGLDHPQGLLIAAISQDKPRKLRLVKYITCRKQTLGWIAARLAEYLGGRSLECLIYDIAMHRMERAAGKTVAQQFHAALQAQGIRIHRGMQPCYNRHEPGIQLVRHYLDPGPGQESLIELNPSPESGCPFVRRQIIAYRTHKPDEFTGPRGVVKVDDESVDCIRYLVNAKPYWVKRPPNPVLWTPDQRPVVVKEPEEAKTYGCSDPAEAENLRRQFANSMRVGSRVSQVKRWR